MGADVNVRGPGGWTPLHWAAKSHPRCVQLLLDAGAGAAIANNHGNIPLHEACKSAECAALLVTAHPAGVNTVFGKEGETPLHCAVKFAAVDVVRVLLGGGSNVDAVNNDGATPLFRALREDRRDIAELLINHGARARYFNDQLPDWARSMMARHACQLSCRAILELARRRSRVIGGNARDVLRLVAKMVWDGRRDQLWMANQRVELRQQEEEEEEEEKRENWKCILF